MKKVAASLILLSLLGVVAWIYLDGPIREVHYRFHESGIDRFADTAEPMRIALIADIHLRETARGEITAEQQTRAIIASFIDSMNNDVKPDFIVQLGDLNDGCGESCAKLSSDAEIIARLERARQYTRDETGIPWFDVIGNHEYASAYRPDLSVIEDKDYSAIYQAIDEDWSKLEDTWYLRDIKGYRFIFLNTAYPNPGRSHRIPEGQIAWLEAALKATERPVFVFMHVPVSAGAGNTYDVAVGQDEVIDLLSRHDRFVAGFFGHSHHSDKWDGLRRQVDHAGNVYFHVPAPHQWMGDPSSHPWVIVDIEPGNDGFTVEVGSGVRRSEMAQFGYYLKETLVKLPRRLMTRVLSLIAG